MKIKTFSKDFFYTCGSQALINGVQHLLVFPWINKYAGSETTGRILACLSIVYIFSNTLGASLNNVRLIEERKGNGNNGDYFVLLTIGSVFLFGVNLVSKHFGFDPQVNIAWFTILSILYMVRAYGLVDYRIKLHFSAYFVFYLLLSIGYAAGILVYKVTNNWTHIFITGELVGLFILYLRKFIFNLSKPSDKLAYVGKAVLLLYLSTFMIQIIVSGDRLILKYFLGDHIVTVYSSLSLAAKIMNMLMLPLGTLLLSYLTAKVIPITKKWLLKITAGWLAFCLCAFIGTLIVAPIYVKLFYPNLYDEIQGLNLIVNVGLALALVGFLFRTYLIAAASPSVVFWFETSFTVIHLILAVYLTKEHKEFGYAWAVIISRTLRAIAGAILTLIFVNKCEKSSLADVNQTQTEATKI